MTQSVLFNGAVLVRAGGATRVDVDAFQNFGVAGLGIVAVIGEAEAGEPDVVYNFTTDQKAVETFEAGPLADAAVLAFAPLSDDRIPGAATRLLAVKVNQSTQAAATLLEGANNSIVLTSKRWGVDANKVTYEIKSPTTGKQIELKYQKSPGDPSTETSPEFTTGQFIVQYTGAGATCSATVSATSFVTAAAGTPADDLTLTFAEFPTVKDLVDKINSTANYTASAVATANPYKFLCADLDRLVVADVKAVPITFVAYLFELVDWVNKNSNLCTAVRAAGASPIANQPPDDVGPLFLTGGTRGISTNTNWQEGFNLLSGVRVNQVVPLISADLTAQGHGSTATMASVQAAADSFAATQSATAGKNECQTYIGIAGTKTAILTAAAALQSPHTVLFANKITRNNAAGVPTAFDEWGIALCAAAGRAGAPLGEPLTHKGIRCTAISQDASWTPDNEGASLILGGVSFGFKTKEGAFIFDRVITTFSKRDNDALVEESLVTNWKNIAYTLRTQLEAVFTGVRGLPATIGKIRDATERVMEGFRKQGAIVDSLEDGKQVKAYRNIVIGLSGDQASVGVKVSLVSGINFQLNTIAAVPATLSA